MLLHNMFVQQHDLKIIVGEFSKTKQNIMEENRQYSTDNQFHYMCSMSNVISTQPYNAVVLYMNTDRTGIALTAMKNIMDKLYNKNCSFFQNKYLPLSGNL